MDEKFILKLGAYPLTGTWDWICLSPKKISYPPRRIMQHELKVIIFNKHDFVFAEEQESK
jgi:hypothetical protein